MRPTCRRCLRPASFCVCALLSPVAPRTRVVILQHPREARLAICSAWLTHLALPGSELRRGVRFGDDPRVRELVAQPGTALLFPGPDATTAERVGGAAPRTLVVVDGTWPQAEKMLRLNPAVAALPRLSLRPDRPSGYAGLRREPADGCLSTIEAVALALGLLEGAPERFEPMCRAFREAVGRQIACTAGGRGRPRHRGPRPGEPPARQARPLVIPK